MIYERNDIQKQVDKENNYKKVADAASGAVDIATQVAPKLAGAGAAGAALGAVGGLAAGALGVAAMMASDTTKTSGSNAANSGMLMPMEAYVILRRNREYEPEFDSIAHQSGLPSNEFVKLANCHGYTKVKDVHIEISCTQDERAEIESLLKQGVIL